MAETRRVTFISPNVLHAPATRAKQNNLLLRIRSQSDYDSPLLQSTTLGPFLWVCLSLSLSGSHSCFFFSGLSVSQTASLPGCLSRLSLSQADSFTRNVYFSKRLPLYETAFFSFPNSLNPLSLCKHDLRASSLLLRTDLPKLSISFFFSKPEKHTEMAVGLSDPAYLNNQPTHTIKHSHGSHTTAALNLHSYHGRTSRGKHTYS